MMWNRVLAIVLVTGLVEIALGAPLSLRYSSQLPADQRQQLEQDVLLLRRFPWKDNSDKSMAKIMGLSQVTALSLEDWLSQRVRYILDPSYKIEFTDENFYLLRTNVEFQVSSAPWIPEVLTLPPRSPQDRDESLDGAKKEDPKMAMTMSNMGSVVYYYGMIKKALLGMPIPGVGLVPISSARVGILQVGGGLFKTLSGTFGEENPISSPFYRLRRLRTLFHEARHSDGNRAHDSRAFGHEQCPADHDYAGFYACDVARNGAYRIGSLIVRSVIENCAQSGNCGVPQLEAFKLLMADDLGRILDPDTAPMLDPTPEGVKN